MRQRLRCLMVSYNFDLQAVMAHLGGGMGDWSGITHNVRKDRRARRGYGDA
jgi:hypothetical protein